MDFRIGFRGWGLGEGSREWENGRVGDDEWASKK